MGHANGNKGNRISSSYYLIKSGNNGIERFKFYFITHNTVKLTRLFTIFLIIQ